MAAVQDGDGSSSLRLLSPSPESGILHASSPVYQSKVDLYPSRPPKHRRQQPTESTITIPPIPKSANWIPTTPLHRTPNLQFSNRINTVGAISISIINKAKIVKPNIRKSSLTTLVDTGP
ncbi:unnamed protein product [Cuscuta europaea]|uniref:Uncharacterized protein n=1 Tax=Cuscuta europaea TaxID=41803 RepID=A0A9P0ZFC9_CUSEU|nr:unnamed protein product [Cuscuta europaea]